MTKIKQITASIFDEDAWDPLERWWEIQPSKTARRVQHLERKYGGFNKEMHDFS